MYYRTETIDLTIIHEVWSGLYTKHFPIYTNDFIADIGAHIGAFSVLASGQTRGMVYAFEPHPGNYKLLVENTRGLPNVIPTQAAVGAERGESLITSRVPWNTGKIATGHGDTLVQVVTLDEIVPGATFLKIDAGGSEIPIIAGGRQLFERGVRVVMEVHRKGSLDEIGAYLQQMGYDVIYEAHWSNWILWAQKRSIST